MLLVTPEPTVDIVLKFSREELEDLVKYVDHGVAMGRECGYTCGAVALIREIRKNGYDVKAGKAGDQ